MLAFAQLVILNLWFVGVVLFAGDGEEFEVELVLNFALVPRLLILKTMLERSENKNKAKI